MARAPLPEKSFPRGGKKAKKTISAVDFGAKKSKTVKKKPNRKKTVVPEKRGFKTSVVRDLIVSDVRPGMVLYGCVDTINELDVQFSLPGNCRGVVSAVNICQQYKNLIEEDDSEIPALSDLFEIGQFFPVMILAGFDGYPKKFKASLQPSEINVKLVPQFLKTGLVLTGSVASVEEHGYVIDLGIPKVTAFLRKDNTTLSLTQCQLIEVFVKSVSSDHCRVQLTTNLSQVDGEIPMNCLLPGFRTKLIVSKVLKGGLEVLGKGLGPDVKGFVHKNHLPKLFDNCLNYPEGSEFDGTLLYIMPIVNIPFFKATDQEQPSWSLSFGDKVKNVKVVSVSSVGLTVKFKEGKVTEKCFIPVKRLDQRSKILDGNAKLSEIYNKGTVLSEIRVENPARVGRFYFAANDRDSLKEAFYSKKDLKIGQIVKCTISVIGKTYCTVEISKYVKGFVPAPHVTELPGIDYSKKFKVGQVVKGRILSLCDGKNARVTLKPSLLKGNILTVDTDVKIGDKYPGTICKIFNHKILVEFFGGRVGEIFKQNMTIAHHGSSISDSFQIGQVINCYIVNSERQKLSLSMICNKDVTDLITIGRKYPTTVSTIADDGVYVEVPFKKNETYPGFIPNCFISNYEGIWKQMKVLWKQEKKLSAVSVYCDSLRNPPILLAVHPAVMDFVKDKKSIGLEKGEIFPCGYFPGSKSCVPVVKHNPNFDYKIHWENISHYKILYAKILEQNSDGIICTTQMGQVWDGRYETSFSFLNDYLKEINAARLNLKKINNPLGGIEIGQKIFAKTDGKVLRLENGVVAKCWMDVGSKVSGRVVWVDFLTEIAWIYPNPKSGPVEVKLEEREFVHAKIIHICPDIIIGDVSGSHEFVFIPTRRHANDVITHEKAYSVGESVKLRVDRIDGKLFGIDRKIAKRKDSLSLRNGPAPKKQKIDDELSVAFEKKGSAHWVDPVKMEILSDDEDISPTSAEIPDESDAEIKSELDSRDDPAETLRELESDSSDDEVNVVKNEPATVFDVGFDWSVAEDSSRRKITPESSSDEEEEDKTEKKKKKRLTGAEKKEKAKETEERLRNREMQLVDPTRPPQSADDFDRLVMTSPDDSSIWLQYMAYHLENTEIEKARAVARRALKNMSFREEQEKMNVWFAFLNLEQLYGDADSQKSVLEEALRCNEPYKVHLHKLNMLADNGVGLEAEKLANVMLKKYGENEDVWPDVGGALMKIGKIDFARSILQRAMTSLPNSKHVALITKFAKLENKFGSSERAQTLYEHVLSAFPKRVDVWSAYVDLMIKSEQFDLARQILERATSQSLPLKKKKTLFKKFIAFEEAHGTQQGVDNIRQAAAEFLDGVAEP